MRRLLPLVLVLAAGAGCAPTSTPRAKPPATIVVHASRALPTTLSETLAKLDGVRWMRVGTTAMVNLVRVDGGSPLPPRPPSQFLPFSIAAAEPLPDGADVISQHLTAGRAVIPSVTSRLRALGAGASITIGLDDKRERLEIGAVVDDPRTEGVEALVPLAAARRLGVSEVRNVVIGVEATHRSAVEQVAPALAAPVPVRVGSHEAIRTPEEGRLLSLAEIKERFGEFTFVEAPGRWLEPDPAWVALNITTAIVPVLGEMRCHRKVMPALTAAMRELQDAGLAHLVTEQSHCYGPRVQFGDTRNISRHTWGIAVDINPSKNGFGQPSTQDPRLIQIMRKHQFAWGGVWLTPDPMHFEYVGS